MKKILIAAGIAGAAIAIIRLVQGWQDNTPSARQLKEIGSDAKELLTEDPAGTQRNPVHAMG